MSVLIVGAGPVGLAMAIELERHGVPYRLVERDAEPHAQSRATDIQARTLEVFHDMGVVEAVLAVGRKRHGVTMYSGGERVVRLAIEGIDTPYCFALGLSQHRTEHILEERLRELGGRVERNVRFSNLTLHDDSVDAVLLHPDGTWEEPRFDWLVGCDGGRSTVRKALALPFEGTTLRDDFFLADIDLQSDQLPADEMALFSSPNGMLAILPIEGNEQRVRVFGDIGVDDEPVLDNESCSALVNARIGVNAKVSNVGWTSLFRIHTRQVESYRKKRAFLCGDAAHCHSPAGGHGMNTGIQDAYNLAWKLALVHHGKAKTSLLDTYHAERHPVGAALLASTEMETKLGLSRSRIVQGAMGTLFKLVAALSPVRQRMLINALELDVNYRNSELSCEQHSSLLHANLVASDAREEPSIGEHRDFKAAPHAGERAPDCAIDNEAGSALFDLLRGTAHTLLLFDGRAPTAEGYARLASLAELIAKRFGDAIRIHLVVPRQERPTELAFDGSVLLDRDATLHNRYGAGAECVYLIRPDGHVGFRSQPADGDALLSHLESYLV